MKAIKLQEKRVKTVTRKTKFTVKESKPVVIIDKIIKNKNVQPK